jgi:hypothetical protein
MLIYIVAFVVVALIVTIHFQPEDFKISRSILSSAPPAALFAQVNDFHKWDAWSPWAKIDPSVKTTYSGPNVGTGAKTAWEGNNKVGSGNMEITESRPADLIRIRLEFVKPFAVVNAAEFTFVPETGGTRVTWTMSGKNQFIAKAFNLVMNSNAMVGGMFDKGLNAMKTVAEAG